jgi:hypothetical protein
MLMICSSRARNRSPDPVVSCFFGRIAPSNAATESRLPIRGNLQNDIASFGRSDPETLQSQKRRRFKIRPLVKSLQVVHGQLDIVVNNASAISLAPVTQTDMKALRSDAHQINTRGTCMVSKYAIATPPETASTPRPNRLTATCYAIRLRFWLVLPQPQHLRRVAGSSAPPSSNQPSLRHVPSDH